MPKRKWQFLSGLALLTYIFVMYSDFGYYSIFMYGIAIALGEMGCAYLDCELCTIPVNFIAQIVMAGYIVTLMRDNELLYGGIAVCLIIISITRNCIYAFRRGHNKTTTSIRIIRR